MDTYYPKRFKINEKLNIFILKTGAKMKFCQIGI